MEVLSIQQHARDTLSRLRMRKRNKNWARDHMRWAGLMWAAGLFWAASFWAASELGYSGLGLHKSRAAWESRAGAACWGGDGTETWARGAAQRRIWWVVAGQRLHRGWTEEAGGCVVSGLRLDRGESGLHRDVGRRAVQRWRLVAIELRFGLLLRQCGG
ncbi:hypothetical protein Acr_11g0012210 [Actinidia rufa]|uniref:Uncharacterized protein n=1 Tax=Actinidia rufa TaxID=165716 RepID=A0A7J0FDZ9_9ERIC|nr:hypothetical protein Acr_11g0012210 [Actinidia rufa]